MNTDQIALTLLHDLLLAVNPEYKEGDSLAQVLYRANQSRVDGANFEQAQGFLKAQAEQLAAVCGAVTPDFEGMRAEEIVGRIQALQAEIAAIRTLNVELMASIDRLRSVGTECVTTLPCVTNPAPRVADVIKLQAQDDGFFPKNTGDTRRVTVGFNKQDNGEIQVITGEPYVAADRPEEILVGVEASPLNDHE